MAKSESAEIVEIRSEASKPRPIRPLTRQQVKLLESVNVRWRAIVPKGTTRADLLVPDMWRILGSDLNPFDKITAVDEASTFYAELIVVTAGQGYAQLVELIYIDLPRIVASDSDVPPNHVIEHAGPERLWVIRRLSDGVMLAENFPSRNEAVQYLLAHASLRA